MTVTLNQPLPQSEWQKDHARRYLESIYGKSVWFRAPETFGNVLERWIWAVASDLPVMAEECITGIESHFNEKERSDDTGI